MALANHFAGWLPRGQWLPSASETNFVDRKEHGLKAVCSTLVRRKLPRRLQPMPSALEPNLSSFDDRVHVSSGLPASAIAAQTRRILASAAFQRSKRLARFLTYAVSHTLAGKEEVLKETILGIEVFDRGPDFDPRIDGIVRIDARRLRARVTEYYQTEGDRDPIVIGFEPGSYVPLFRAASLSQAQQSAPPVSKGPKRLLTLTRLAKARHQLNSLSSMGIVKSAALFESIIAEDPDNVPAYVGHATALIAMAMFFYESAHTAMPRARASIERALAIDPASAEAHVALGGLRALYDFDLAAAHAAFLMAFRFKPDLVWALHARAAFYFAPMGLLDDAVADIRRALEYEPGSLSYLVSLGWMQYLRGDYTAAVTAMDEALKRNRHLTPARYLRALAYERLGKYELASAAFAADELSRPHPLLPMRAEALRLLRSGRKQEAIHVARKMEALYSPGFLNALAISEVFAALQEYDAAFRWLEASYQDRRHFLIYLKSDPAWDPIRTDPRFTELLAKLGLEQDAAKPSRNHPA